ncbi:MAG: hypothetical protein MK066_12670 [Crocinitomicaceae bacterium]|nr:hypothetical protein [Crocinitomicaceae bacterium]
MKHLLIILYLAVAFNSAAHDYYFAFAELEYNDFTKKFESTITASSHDLERVLAVRGIDVDSLDLLTHSSEKFIQLEGFLNEGFVIANRTTKTHLSIVGVEILLNGIIHFFLESESIEVNDYIDVEFSFLMSEFPEQQNKLTLYMRDKSYTKTFLQGDFTRQILIE